LTRRLLTIRPEIEDGSHRPVTPEGRMALLSFRALHSA